MLNCELARLRSTPIDPARIEEVELIDPAKIEEDVWKAGVDEWVLEEGNDPSTVPLEPSKWEALLRRLSARIRATQIIAEEKQHAKAQLQKRRQLLINSPKPPGRAT